MKDRHLVGDQQEFSHSLSNKTSPFQLDQRTAKNKQQEQATRSPRPRKPHNRPTLLLSDTMQHKSGDKGSAHCGSVAVSIVGIVFGSAVVIVVCSFIYCLIRRQLNLRDKYARCNGNCECEGASRPPPTRLPRRAPPPAEQNDAVAGPSVDPPPYLGDQNEERHGLMKHNDYNKST
ncbi:unnamed protein product [Clonostachys rosea]|uniref:Mid2 domain-containing protein n=1 Tax=Bionectria ochroleuca TaxID=29856 RepID=A0ABY6URC8_BIOOC|nr:unnamed protein product [Clonostachys rosea]